MTQFPLDEINVDYGKLMKNTVTEGLRVEDLVKKYFEAAEQVKFVHNDSTVIYIYIYFIHFL